jgi:hypothetical protein
MPAVWLFQMACKYGTLTPEGWQSGLLRLS